MLIIILWFRFIAIQDLIWFYNRVKFSQTVLSSVTVVCVIHKYFKQRNNREILADTEEDKWMIIFTFSACEKAARKIASFVGYFGDSNEGDDGDGGNSSA
ncbi:unnamed protein product [Brugia timori]|uniref:Secreted protein n=1 Tax=Brugia timori TaxID=42155 RepID=A0A0R3QX44_9BILA|nr:unnamed protein product [Brugia timori]